MLALPLFLFSTLLTTLRIRTHQVDSRLDTEGICYTCGYDLSATPRPLPCPECGATTREHYRTRPQTSFSIRPRALLWSLALAPLLPLYFYAATPIAQRLFACSYPGGSPATHRRLAELEYSSLFWPVEVTIGLSPLLVFIPAARQRLLSLAILLLSTAIATAADWYLRYRF